MTSRSDLTCSECNTTGLSERRTADQFDTEREEIFYATECPNCGCRVDPSHIREQLPDEPSPDSFQEKVKANLRDFSIQFTTRTITSALAVILLVSSISLGAAFGGVSVFSGERGVSATSNPAAAASGSVLTGTIQAPNGNGVDDATVAVVGNSSLTTETGPNGTYQFSSVPPGEHEVLVSSAAYGTTGETVAVEANDSNTESISFASNDVGSSEESTGQPSSSDDIESEPVLIGTVQDPDDEAIEGATVSIEDHDLSTETDSEGRYRIEEVSTGDVDVEVTHPEYEPSTLDINVDEEDSPETLYPTLNPDPNTQAVLIGTVEDQDSGEGIDSADIELSAQDSDDVIRTESDGEGQYRVEDVLSGDVEVEVTHPDYYAASRTLDIDAAQTATAYFELKPLPPAAWEKTIRSGNSTPIFRTSARVTTPRAPPETQSVRLWSPVSTDRVTTSDEARGVTNLSLPGNRLPTNLTVAIGDAADKTPRNLSQSIPRDATNTSIPLSVGGDIPADVELRIDPSTNTSTENTTGRVTRADTPLTLDLAGDDLPTQLEVELRGLETLTPHNYSAVGDTTYNISYNGNRPAIGNTTAQPQLTIRGPDGKTTTVQRNGITNSTSLNLDVPGVSVSGAANNSEPTINVTGRNTTGDPQTLTQSTTGDLTIPYEGNRDAVNKTGQGDPVITLSKATDTGSGSETSTFTGRTTDYRVDDVDTGFESTWTAPNVDAIDNATIQFTGQTDAINAPTGEQTISSDSPQEITVDSDKSPTNESITLSAPYNEVPESKSDTVSSGKSTSLQVDSDVAPTNEEITLSAPYEQRTPSVSGVIQDADTISFTPQATYSTGQATINLQGLSNSVGETYNLEGYSSSHEFSRNKKVDRIVYDFYHGGSAEDYPKTNYEVILDGNTEISGSAGGYYDNTKTISVNQKAYEGDYFTVWQGADLPSLGSATVYYTKPDQITVNGQSVSPTGSVTIPTEPGRTEDVIIDDLNGLNLSYEVTWTETDAVGDISGSVGDTGVDVDGPLTGPVDKDVDLRENSDSIDLTYSGSDGQLNYDASWTETSAVTDIFGTVGNTQIDTDGPLTEPVKKTVDLSDGAPTIDLTYGGSAGPLTYNASWTEIRETTNPSATINGVSVPTSTDTQLDNGETESVPIPEDTISTGSNNLSIQTDDGNVDANVSYDIVENVTTDYSMEEWQSGYPITATFPKATTDPQVTVPFTSPRVTGVENVEYRVNYGDWRSVSLSNYTVDQSGVTINVSDPDDGSLSADSTVEVRFEREADPITVTGSNGTELVNRTKPLTVGSATTATLPITDDRTLDVDFNGSTSYNATVAYRPRNMTDDIQIDVGHDGVDATAGPLAEGETRRIPLPNMTADSEQIGISASHSPVAYNVSYNASTASYNIKVRDNGTTIAERDRPLLDGQTMTMNLSITEDRNLTISADGSNDYTSTLAYQTRNVTNDVQIETTNDNTPEVDAGSIAPGDTASYSIPADAENVTISADGPVGYAINYSATRTPEDVELAAGNTSTTLSGPITAPRAVTLEDAKPGTETLDINSTHSGFDLTATWTDRNGTIDPTVTLVRTGETIASADGWLNETRTFEIDNATIESQTPTLAFETDAGMVPYEIRMDGHAVATNATVTVNGIPTSYPGSFTANGTLPTDSSAAVERDITALSGTESVIALDSDPVDGVDTRVAAEVSYFNESAS